LICRRIRVIQGQVADFAVELASLRAGLVPARHGRHPAKLADLFDRQPGAFAGQFDLRDVSGDQVLDLLLALAALRRRLLPALVGQVQFLPDRLPTGIEDQLAGLHVTERLVELDVRIENQRESVTAVRRLMAEATDLTDLVLLEGELTRRQTDLDILLARQAELAGRVEMATITIDVYAPGGTPDPNRSVLDGFADGWLAFVAVVGALAWFLAALSPFLAVGVALAGLVVVLVRRRRH
jgi:hypothetical protein